MPSQLEGQGLLLQRAMRIRSTPDRVLAAFFDLRASAFFLADVYYTPPEGAPIGPMALEVQTRPMEEGRSTELVIRQSADDEGPRWQRYFAVMGDGWDRALDSMKDHLEWAGVRPPRGVMGTR